MERHKSVYISAALFGTTICAAATAQEPTTQPRSPDGRMYLSQPLVTSIFTADPSAHVFDGRIYVYASHDVSDGPSLPDVEPFKGSKGNGFKMRDYVVLSMDRAGGPVTVHEDVLHIKDVPWAARQMWAPDAAFKNGTYFLYFPSKARDGAFRIGVATSKHPAGPFIARPEPIAGSYSIDPCLFTDDDGQSYLYFGGLSGGQLQMIVDGEYDPPRAAAATQASPPTIATMPRVARLRADMLEFAEKPRDAVIADERGAPLAADASGERRFFEGVWVHKYRGTYYLSYSTGGTHLIAYATSASPYGPFAYRGTILKPVQGWTTHHSIVEHAGKWWLFYADSQLSNKTFLRNVKVAELTYNDDGTIQTIDPFVGEPTTQAAR